MAGVELTFLRLSPIWWGYGVPHGDGSAVVLVPGFLGTDLYLSQFSDWLRRIDYQPFYSGIELNADCPNILIRRRLNETIEQACKSTRGKIHLIGHSLGGSIARSAAAQMPGRIASVITLAAPIRGLEAHASIQRAADLVRQQILERHGRGVLPTCYTARCTCDFVESLKDDFPDSVRQTAIYSKSDGILNWRVCRTGDPNVDFEVSSTHIGMVFSPLVYNIVAQRLAGN
ncbi:MAG TPA: alpha/beta fold hydrolase [Candidatus Acidoferrales bacterium]|nr:alpha/beta fold hydrolase [Candidatus Acidoferrales bacterium]